MIELLGDGNLNSPIYLSSATYGTGLTAYNLSFDMILLASPSANRQVLGMWDDPGTAAATQFRLQLTTNNKFRVEHSDGITIEASSENTNSISLNTIVRVGVTWDGANVTFYINGTADGSPAFTRAIQGTSIFFTIGSPVLAGAPSMRIGNVIFGSVSLSASLMTSRSVGAPIGINPPITNAVDIWEVGDTPFHDRVARAAPQLFGTVSPVDGSFTGRPRTGMFKTQSPTEAPVVQVIDDTVNVSEDVVENLPPVVIIIDETLQIQDGDNNDLYDPAGAVQETMADGTVWTRTWPPFVRRTKWTSV